MNRTTPQVERNALLASYAATGDVASFARMIHDDPTLKQTMGARRALFTLLQRMGRLRQIKFVTRDGTVTYPLFDASHIVDAPRHQNETLIQIGFNLIAEVVLAEMGKPCFNPDTFWSSVTTMFVKATDFVHNIDRPDRAENPGPFRFITTEWCERPKENPPLSQS